MTKEVLDAVNSSNGRVLIGLIYGENYGVWRARVTYDVLADESLVRQLTCSDFQRRESETYWEAATRGGFDGTELELAVAGDSQRLAELQSSDASETIPTAPDPQRIGAADLPITLVVDPNGQAEAILCYGQREVVQACIATSAGLGARVTQPIAIDSGTPFWIGLSKDYGFSVVEQTLIEPVAALSTVVVTMTSASSFEVTSS